MIGSRGLTLTLVLLLGWASRSSAQTVADARVSVATIYNKYIYAIEPNGGFGLETIQIPFAGAFWLDQFGLVHAIEPAQPLPRIAARRSAPKSIVAPASHRVSKTGARLPTGSLAWPGASGVVLYSPWLRYQSYGSGYGRGPYGNADCGIMYKGMWLGH